MRVLLTLFLLSSLLTDLPARAISFSADCETIYFCTNEFNCGPTLVEHTATATTTCTTGGLTIDYAIDLDDDGTVDESGTNNAITGNYPMGNHRVIFTATDDCSNEEICEFLFMVEDCTAPIALTLNGIAGEANASQDMILNADVLNIGSTDNCGISSLLMVTPSQGPGQTVPPIEATSTLVFSCEDLGTQTVDFWVGDNAGNWNYKSTYVLVQNNTTPLCLNNDFVVCFSSYTECGEAIGNVEYAVGAPGLPDMGIGNQCDTLTTGFNYVFSAHKDIHHLNGVSTFDLVLIAKHILDIQLLDSPYKIISADANHSGAVSTLDLVEIRKLILGLIPEFSNNTSWRFIDSSFVFPNPQDPFQTSFPEICSYNGDAGDIFKTFIGMKIGDVNKSVNPGFSAPESESEVRSTFNFNLNDQRFEAGEIVKLDFFAEEINQLAGFQFALDFNTDYLDFENFEKGNLKHLDEPNFNFQAGQGLISSSWVNMDFDKNEKTEGTLFSLQFIALKSGSLKDFIQLSDSKLSPEAYTLDLNISDLKINFSEVVPKIDFSVKSTPNPFHEETVLQFELLHSERVTVKIMDVKGQVIKTIQRDFEKGVNEIKLLANLFSTSGVYFYQLETSEGSTTGKLLKL